MTITAFAVKITHDNRTYRFWSGSRELVLQGETYEGTFVKAADGTETQAMSLTAPEYVSGDVGQRCRFAMSVNDETIRRAVSQDLGPVECEVYWIYPQATQALGPFRTRFEEDFSLDNPIELEATLENEVFTGQDITVGQTTPGRWNTRGAGSTPSGNTGPGTNTIRSYVYYETSSQGYNNSPGRSILNLTGGTGMTASVANWVRSANPRRITVDVCMQGAMYNLPSNGLWLWGSATPPDFTGNDADRMAAVRLLYHTRIPGWQYNNSYTAGATITDYAGDQFLCQFNGGWRRVELEIPSTWRHMGFAVDVATIPSNSSNFHGDAAITGIKLEERTPTSTEAWAIADQFFGNLSAPELDIQSATYSADIEGEFGRYGRGQVKKWSDAQQKADHPGDTSLENVTKIEQGKLRIRW